MVKDLLIALFATAGYCLLVNVPRRLLLPAAFGGALSWGMYLLLREHVESIFFLIVVVSAGCAVYSELAAKVAKAPATIFLIPGLIPLVPGSYVYYMMSALVQNDAAGMKQYGVLTAQWALGLAAGISIIAVIRQIIDRLLRRKKSM